MSSANAWLLECSGQLTIAAGDHEIIECIQAQGEQQVPLAPDYCNSVLVWQNRPVPIFDLGLAIGLGDEGYANSLVCLLNYQLAPRQPLQQLALRVRETPEKVFVDDAQAIASIDVPGNGLLDEVTLACFRHGQQPVAVIDIARLCSRDFSDAVQARALALFPGESADESSQVDSR